MTKHLVTLPDIPSFISISRTTLRRFRRRVRRASLRLLLGGGARLRRLDLWFREQVAKMRFASWALAPSLLVLVAARLVYHNRVQWQKSSEVLADKGTLSQLEIAVGAAVLGVIGIVFSLSLFSIQQAAERGTALTLREYARDWVFRTVYWTLALFAFLEMLSALQKNQWGLFRACLTLSVLAASFLMLRVYFYRAVKFVDPHFTIAKISKRARKSLAQIQRLERTAQAEFRYQRIGRRK